MATKRAAKQRQELLSRELVVTSTGFRVSTYVDKQRGVPLKIESGPWLELQGNLNDEIRGVRATEFNVHPHRSPGDQKEIRCVGAIISLRPTIQVVVSIASPEFDRLWQLALSGHLKFIHFVFHTPYRLSSLVVNAAFSNRSDLHDG